MSKKNEGFYGQSRLLADKCLQVKRFIEANPGCTNEEIAMGTGLRIQTVTPRTKELKENGVVWITGRAQTSSHSSAAEHSLASCPSCMGHSLSIQRSGNGFRYHCNNCGRDFAVTTDPEKKKEVKIR